MAILAGKLETETTAGRELTTGDAVAGDDDAVVAYALVGLNRDGLIVVIEPIV